MLKIPFLVNIYVLSSTLSHWMLVATVFVRLLVRREWRGRGQDGGKMKNCIREMEVR